VSWRHVDPSVQRGIPRAGLDPICCQVDALAVISTAVADPIRDQVIVLTLDERRCGIDVVIVDDTRDPDAVVDVIESVADALSWSESPARYLVAATIRTASGTLPSDVDRWFESRHLAQLRQLQLIDWFVVSADSLECPRDLVGEPSDW
jgi:hypothetical protein